MASQQRDTGTLSERERFAVAAAVSYVRTMLEDGECYVDVTKDAPPRAHLIQADVLWLRALALAGDDAAFQNERLDRGYLFAMYVHPKHAHPCIERAALILDGANAWCAAVEACAEARRAAPGEYRVAVGLVDVACGFVRRTMERCAHANKEAARTEPVLRAVARTDARLRALVPPGTAPLDHVDMEWIRVRATPRPPLAAKAPPPAPKRETGACRAVTRWFTGAE
jgi:hypothetical protein